MSRRRSSNSQGGARRRQANLPAPTKRKKG